MHARCRHRNARQFIPIGLHGLDIAPGKGVELKIGTVFELLRCQEVSGKALGLSIGGQGESGHRSAKARVRGEGLAGKGVVFELRTTKHRGKIHNLAPTRTVPGSRLSFLGATADETNGLWGRGTFQSELPAMADEVPTHNST